MTAMAADTDSGTAAAGGTDSARAVRAPAGRGAHDTPALLLLVPLIAEAAVLAGAPPDVTVLRTGMGRRRAVAAAQRALRTPADAVAVAGFCGGLTGHLRTGDVVVATSLAADGEPWAELRPPGPAGAPAHAGAGRLTAALRARGIERVHAGRIVSSSRIVRGAERTRLAADGALAVDMESAWLRAAAGGRPLAVLRVVLDTPATRLSRPRASAGDLLAACRALRRAAPALLDWAHAVTAYSPRA